MAPVLGAKGCSTLIDRLLGVEGLKNIRELRPLLRTPDHGERPKR